MSAAAFLAGAAVADDPGTAYRLLVSCPSGLPMSRVLVEFSPSFDRISHPDRVLEKSIDETWNKRLEKNPSFYNGMKFRYGGHCWRQDANSSSDSGLLVCLHLGLTDYKTFLGTNLNPLWEEFLVSSIVDDESIRCRHMANPLGNGAIVETADGKILVLKRSCNVGEFPGYYVFPGGHPEPQEIGISSHASETGVLGSSVLAEKVSQEMFDGIIREVVEEIGVSADTLSEPLFIGVSRREMNVRPTAFFFLRCSMNSGDVHEMYKKAQDGYESTQLSAVSADDLERMAIRMPGCHRGGLALYELMRKEANTS